MIGESTSTSEVTLVLTEGDRDRIVKHLRSALPNEGVGLLAVEWIMREGEHIAESRQFYPGANFRASPDRFELDPRELIAALRDVDLNGWSLGAIVHSHPLGAARPSQTDLDEAFYPESLMLIASFTNDPPDLQAWRLEQIGDEFVPVSVRILV
jgi:proteasome lid subunit RPN8/RPN11